MRTLLLIPLTLLLTYALLFAGFYVVMCQKPGVFGAVMSKAPGFVFMAFPFRRMWLSAREGRLRVGDEAPDFDLQTHDKKSRVRLSDLRGKRPVVLVFGSYT